MADRRMMSKKIIDSDAFLEMPLSSQALYFHLLLRADDDGFLNSARKIMREVGANQNDYDVLVMKRFLIQFEDGICVIKHWRIHNYIQRDRYKPTLYTDERSLLVTKDNGAYSLNTECTQDESDMSTDCVPYESSMDTDCVPCTPRLGKVSIGKDSNTVSNDTVRSTDVQRIIDAWNSLPGLSHITKLVSGTQRYEWLKVRIREYGIVDVLKAIENIRYSPFLLGQSKGGWTVTFDWVVRPNNFPKVLDGNYLEGNLDPPQPDNTEGGNKKWQ